MFGRTKIVACAVLVWVVTVAGVIGGGVPPADAAAPSAAQAEQVEALALARFGAQAGPSVGGVGVPAVTQAEALALARGVAGLPGAVPAHPTDSLALAATEAAAGETADLASLLQNGAPLVGAAVVDVENDPWEFDPIEQELLDRVKEASKETVKRPGFDVWPGFDQLQLVGLGTWFRVEDDAWVEDVEVSQELAFEELIAVGNPYRVQSEFANGE